MQLIKLARQKDGVQFTAGPVGEHFWLQTYTELNRTYRFVASDCRDVALAGDLYRVEVCGGLIWNGVDRRN